MEISAFLRRLLANFASALFVVFTILTIGEYVVPGVVLPFVDMVDLTIPMIVVVGLSLAFPPDRSRP